MASTADARACPPLVAKRRNPTPGNDSSSNDSFTTEDDSDISDTELDAMINSRQEHLDGDSTTIEIPPSETASGDSNVAAPTPNLVRRSAFYTRGQTEMQENFTFKPQTVRFIPSKKITPVIEASPNTDSLKKT
jgi:hypothetical protein